MVGAWGGASSTTAMERIKSTEKALELASERDLFDDFKDNRLDPVGVSVDAFRHLCNAMFPTESVEEVDGIAQLAFARFDRNADAILDTEEFSDCFHTWIQTNDFITGTLALRDSPAGQDGAEVVPIINQIVAQYGQAFHSVVYSQDWHPADHCSFLENVKRLDLHESSKVSPGDCKPFDIVVINGDTPHEQALFPAHCVQDSPGAALHSDLTIVPNAVVIQKGLDSDIDSYSVFVDNQAKSQTKLNRVLTESGITDVYCCGLATDYCVGSSVLDALKMGYRTVTILDACRGCSLAGIADMKERIRQSGGLLTDTEHLAELLGLSSHRSIALAAQGLSEQALERGRANHAMSI